MKILTVDIGTGTQDIFLYDSNLDIENGYKLVLPSPTMMVRRRVQAATRTRTPVLLAGWMMGGGPSSWAVEEHLKAGCVVYATPDAARTLDDDLERVAGLGVRIVSDDESYRLSSSVVRLDLKDFDFPLIAQTFAGFGVPLEELSAVAVAVFDHGAAPQGFSDRQFRFDYLDERIRQRNSLAAFAYLAEDIPPIMTRLQSVSGSAQGFEAPLVVMDTAPAAVLGATYDPVVAKCERKLIVNAGNFHTLAFRLGPAGIEGLFEHHTGLVNLTKLDALLHALADGSLQHADVFDDHGHGALIYDEQPLGTGRLDVIVTGPRRSIFQLPSDTLRPYFAVPFGDMMLSGNIGLLAAVADLLPETGEDIYASLDNEEHTGIAPWDA